MLNQCNIIGHLGADPEVKSFNNGGRICNFRIAVSEKWRDKNTGEQKERTEWIPVTISNDGLVGVAERFLRKGSKVFVSGQFRTRKWQDQHGNDRYSSEIVLSGHGAKLVMLDGGQGSGSGNGGGGNTRRHSEPATSGFADDGFDDDEIPFVTCDPRWERRAH
jgi:single-strand DNA-binding protein